MHASGPGRPRRPGGSGLGDVVTAEQLSELVDDLATRGGLLTHLQLTARSNDNAKVRYRQGRPVVFVDPGALRRPDEEVTGQVAHELGHVAVPPSRLARHPFLLLFMWTALLLSLLVLAVAGVPYSFVAAAIANGVSVVAGAALFAHSQRSELAADRFAVELVGAAPVLAWLHASAQRHPDTKAPRFLGPYWHRADTHPTWRRRIDAITGSVEARPPGSR